MKKITQREIAKMAGISEVWLSKIVNRRVKKFSNIEVARRIEIASQGKWKAVDLIPELKKFVDP